MNPQWTNEYSGYQKYWSVFEVPDSWWKPAAERRAREPAKPSSFAKLKAFAGGVRARVFGREQQEVQEQQKMVLVFFDYSGGAAAKEGHIPETLELARALVEQGHTVHYFAHESSRAMVASVGAFFQPYDHRAQVKLADDKATRLRHTDSITSFRLDEVAIAQVKDVGMTIPNADDLPHSHAMLPAAVYLLETGLLKEVERLGAQCIVCDAKFPWGRIVADKLKIPLVASSSSNYLTLGSDSNAQAEAAELANVDYIQACVSILKDKYGVDYDASRISYNYSEFTIAWTVPEFEPNASAMVSQGVHFYGASFPATTTRVEGGDTVKVVKGEELHGFPFAKLRARKEAGDKVVFCLLEGKAPQVRRSLVNSMVSAFGGLEGVSVVLGPVEEVDELPENFFGCSIVPKKSLLVLADVLVSQMNSTSVNEAAYVGVPMIALPMTGEQQFNADRVVALSLGTSLVVSADGSVDKKLLSDALEFVQSDTIKAGCVEMKQMMEDYHNYLMSEAAKDILAYIKMYGKESEVAPKDK